MTPEERILKLRPLFSQILELLNIDIHGEHVVDTPDRVSKMYVRELCRGLFEEPPEITLFPAEGMGEHQMVTVTKIPVISLCSHHLVPFTGTADIAYIPAEYLIGLSKFSRVVSYFGAKPQVQENLTNEIGNFLVNALLTSDVAVRIKAEHHCMTIRGVKQPGVQTITSFLSGMFLTKESVKAEFYQNVV